MDAYINKFQSSLIRAHLLDVKDVKNLKLDTDISLLVSIVGAFGTCCGTILDCEEWERLQSTIGIYQDNIFYTPSGTKFGSETTALRKKGFIALYYRMPIFSDNKSFGPVTIVKPFFFVCFGAIALNIQYDDNSDTCVMQFKRSDGTAEEFYRVKMPFKLFQTANHIRSIVYNLAANADNLPAQMPDLRSKLLNFACSIIDYELESE